MRIVDPPHARIFESWQPFEDFFCRDNQGWVVPHINKIRSLADNYDFVIANCSTEHWGNERDFPLVARLHDLLAEHYTKDFVCLCHEPSDEKLREHILYFPFFAWRKIWNPIDPTLVTNCDRNYLFSNLNHIARDFRIAFYLRLKAKSWADQCLITMHNNRQENHAYDGNLQLTAAEFMEWNRIKDSLPSAISDGFGHGFDSKHPAFADTYLHVVSETTVKDKIFLTEKTWQPIWAGQLFMIWGNSGIIAHLRDLGVDVFDDIVDHEYDTITDYRNRLESIHRELDRLAALNWPHIYHTTTKRRQKNADDFVSGLFISKCVDRLKSKLPKGTIKYVSRC
jgi:hypothetical protein